MKIAYLRRNRNDKLGRGLLPKYVYEQLMSLWRECVRAFVKDLIVSLQDHVDTGMSMASIHPLAASVRFANVLEQSIRGYGPKPPYTELLPGGHKGRVIPTTMKSKTLGRSLGVRPKGYNLTFGTQTRPVLSFIFNIVVWQYYINEYGLGNAPEAWGSIDLAKQAFWQCYHDKFETYVNPKRITAWLLEGP